MVIQRKRAGKGTQVFGFGAGFAAAGAGLPLILSLMQASCASLGRGMSAFSVCENTTHTNTQLHRQ